MNRRIFIISKILDELLLKTMLALNRSYLIHLGQHNLLKILKVDSFIFF